MNKTKIYLSIEAYQKMRLWVEMAKGEISWLGSVSELKDQDGLFEAFLIEDIHLLKQTCSSANTVLDDQSVGQFLTEMVVKNQDTSKIKAWLHSHATMNCFWSTIDEDCITNLANSSYVISIVTNKEGDILARIDIFKPFHITVNEVVVDIYYPADESLKNTLQERVQRKGHRIDVHSGGSSDTAFSRNDGDRPKSRHSRRTSKQWSNFFGRIPVGNLGA